MPDPSMSEAMQEAAALAPVEEIFFHTLEVRHPDFVDANGNPDSLWLVADTQNLVAPIEADAPVKPGQYVTFTALAFNFALAPIEAGATPEIEITLDGVNRALIYYFDLAAAAAVPLVIAYRPYLDSAIADGPQMDPVLTFEVADVTVGLSSVKMKARTGVDLRGAFPRKIYEITTFPGLAGR